ncbi:hypothetical protein J2S74_000561 [Evansella vedderi]|uniref:Uncharacterized protein n=1 Tax=Evansella vedderi TaxID=38282 RepID=A0ABT9ZPR0_9BACI|nr:hypothetical protein [Evansella vedderi]MDQ0253189.1 hypothetical protein [Evansella vedderi]
MKKTRHWFKVNPFLILGIIHFVMLLYTFYKQRNRKKLFVLLLSNIGLAYVFDYIAVGNLKAYRYKPKLMKEPYLDHIIGAIFSQSFYVPITAVFITAFQLGWKVKLFFSVYFCFIEKLFLKWKIHKNHWWKVQYTFVLINFYFWLSDKWNEKLKERHPIILFFSLFHMIEVTWKTIWFPLALSKKARLGVGEYYSWKEHFYFSPTYFYSLSFIFTLFRKVGWKSYFVRLGLITLTDTILMRLNYLKVRTYFPLLIIHITTLSFANIYRRWVYE